MRSSSRATSASMPACRSACRRCWCSGCAPRASRRSCRRPIRSRSASREAVLCVGTESMSRNPIASYSHRGGFRMGQVEFKDFLWEATMDTAPKIAHGRHGRGTGQALPDHARRDGCLCCHELRPGEQGARGRLLQGRGGAGRCRAVCARGLPDARDQASARGEGGGSGRASAADAAGSSSRRSRPRSRVCRRAATARPSSMVRRPSSLRTER